MQPLFQKLSNPGAFDPPSNPNPDPSKHRHTGGATKAPLKPRQNQKTKIYHRQSKAASLRTHSTDNGQTLPTYSKLLRKRTGMAQKTRKKISENAKWCPKTGRRGRRAYLRDRDGGITTRELEFGQQQLPRTSGKRVLCEYLTRYVDAVQGFVDIRPCTEERHIGRRKVDPARI